MESVRLFATNKSATEQRGTTTCVSTLAAELKAPFMVGASTAQNTNPVSVMETVKTNFMLHSHCGISPPRRSCTVCHTANTNSTAATHRLDCTVKYKNPFTPIAAVSATPTAADRATANSKITETIFLVTCNSLVL